MKPLGKIGLVVAGYAIAVVVAIAAVACHVMAIGNQASGGMSAFGDSILFLAVFGVASVLPTSAGLFFLRPYPAVWRLLSVVAFIVALTGLAAFIVTTVESHSALAAVAYSRILVAPIFAMAFGLSGVFAPNHSARIALFIAAGIEAATFAGAILWLFHFWLK